jgi:predicted SnoaL-like aldol condensation-catalyzing enzyme
MPDIEENKRNVIAYYERAFNDHEPEDAVERYVGSEYIQHNPMAPDGTDAFIAFVRGYVEQFPQLHIEIKRAIGEGDLVMTHGLLKRSPDDRGTAAADIFRVDENGKIVEHWDVLQPVPETSANDNTMF